MSAKAVTQYPHEARVQRYGYAALALAVVLALAFVLRSDGALLGLEVPSLWALGLVGAGALTGVVAVVRRAVPVALVAAAFLVLAVLPGGALDPGLGGYAVGFGFGAALLAFAELVHQTSRYDRAHKLVEEEGVSEESLDRVTDEALKTLLARTGLAVAGAFLAVLLAWLLATLGPRAWREALETASPLGVAVLALGLYGATGLFILARGSRLPRPAKRERAAPELEVVATDVPE